MKNKKLNKASRQAGHRLCKKISKSPVTYFYKPSFNREAYITGDKSTINIIGGKNTYTLEQSTDVTGLHKLQEEMKVKKPIAVKNTVKKEQKKSSGSFGWWLFGIGVAASLVLVSTKMFK